MYQIPQQRQSLATVSTGGLLGQVLAITGAGFLITAATTYLTASLALPTGVSFAAMLVGFLFLLAISGTRRNPALSLVMFYLFAACEGVGIGPVVSSYARLDGPGVVLDAASTTGLGMLVLAAIVYLTSFDYRRLSGIAFGALIVLVIAGLVSAFTHFLHPGVYAWLTLAVFTLLVLVDFSRIRAGGGGQSAVELATSIYLDSINIFLALLQIFGMRSRDD
jgi:modulator of FtsH protease